MMLVIMLAFVAGREKEMRAFITLSNVIYAILSSQVISRIHYRTPWTMITKPVVYFILDELVNFLTITMNMYICLDTEDIFLIYTSATTNKNIHKEPLA